MAKTSFDRMVADGTRRGRTDRRLPRGLHKKFDAIIDVDATQPPYANTRRLISVADVGGDSKRAHSTVQPGKRNPKTADGAEAYEPVWRYLFTHPTEQVGAPTLADPTCRVAD